MKLAATETPVQVSSEDLKTSKFGIGDPGIIIRHMTKTLYSDPIQSIVREIMSNGRDSHIETKKTNVPIRVKLPTKNNPTWEVRDWGPGIDPDRFENVYKQFGNSTKRGNNKESGGFGVGAKTPWAYSDTFTVTTTAKEKNLLVKRFYACVMGEDATGVEIAPKVTIDPNDESIPLEDRGTGTIVSLTVKEEDIVRFGEETVNMTEFWKVRPELYGRNPLPQYRNYTNEYEGKNWKIIQSPIWRYSNQSFVCIDGIPYPFNLGTFASSLKKGLNSDTQTLLQNFSFVWDCNVGELDLSLNREQLMYTDRTCEALMLRIHEIMKELKIQLEEKIKNAKNLWDAHVQWLTIQNTFRYGCPIKKVSWNNHSLEKSNICVSTNANTGAKVNSYLRKDRNGVLSLRRHESHYFTPAERTKLIFCDEDKIDLSKIRRLMQEDDKLHEVVVVRPNNVGPDEGGYIADKAWDTVKDAIHFDLFNPTMLSSIAKIEREKKDKDPNAPSAKVTVQAYLYDASRQKFVNESADLKDGSGIYIEVFRGDFITDKDKTLVSGLLHIDPAAKIYGIPQRFASNLGSGWTTVRKTFTKSVDAYLKTINVGDTNKMLAFKELYAKESYLNCENIRKILKNKIIADVLGPDHGIYKLYDLIPEYNKFLKAEESVTALQGALEIVGKNKGVQMTGTDATLTAYNEEANKLKLLLHAINMSFWSTETFIKTNKQHVIDYLTAMK